MNPLKRRLPRGWRQKNPKRSLREIWLRLDNRAVGGLNAMAQLSRRRATELLERRTLDDPARRHVYEALARIFRRADAVARIRALPVPPELMALADALDKSERLLCERINLRDEWQRMARRAALRLPRRRRQP